MSVGKFEIIRDDDGVCRFNDKDHLLVNVFDAEGKKELQLSKKLCLEFKILKNEDEFNSELAKYKHQVLTNSSETSLSSEEESSSEESEEGSSSEESEEESDVSSSSDSSDGHQQPTPSKTFSSNIRTKMDLKNYKFCPPLLTAEELSSPDNEVWIVTIPKKLNANKLHDAKLSLTESTSIEVGNENYETIIKKKASELAFVLPNKKGEVTLTIRKTEGIVAVVGDVSLPVVKSQTVLNNKTAITAPKINFKRRHPIHGTDLNKGDKQSTRVAKKIKTEISTKLPVQKKKSNKSKLK